MDQRARPARVSATVGAYPSPPKFSSEPSSVTSYRLHWNPSMGEQCLVGVGGDEAGDLAA